MASVEKETQKSRVLVISGTGHLGKHIVAASIRLGHPAAVLIRDTTLSDPAKAQLLKSFVDSGATLFKVLIATHHGSVRYVLSSLFAHKIVFSTY
jgi:phenylcoumaran benzylic ether reductase